MSVSVGWGTQLGGYQPVTVGAGVANVNETASASAVPFADFVPAGTSTLYSVAIGNRGSGSNIRVFVPSHRHCPAGSGVSFTGTTFDASDWEVTATIGWS